MDNEKIIEGLRERLERQKREHTLLLEMVRNHVKYDTDKQALITYLNKQPWANYHTN